MAETLRDMVVSLSLNSDKFSANLRSINQQLKEADSQFKLAASGVTNFENTAAGAQAQLASLQQKFQLQQQAVQQYERALEAAKGKLETSVQTHEKLAAKLDTARQRHADLGQQVDKLTADLREAEEAGQKGTDAYAEMEAELERLKSEYAASGQEVQKLEGQLSRSENAMRRNADAVTKANTNLNNARAGLQQIQSHIDQVTSRLQRHRPGISFRYGHRQHVCTGTGDVLYACLCGSDGEGQPEIQHLRGPAWRRHAQGLGVEQDYAQAAKLFASVAASENKSATGVVDAGYELARLYEQGLGVEQDLDRAIDLYEEAEENGSEDAVAALERLGK